MDFNREIITKMAEETATVGEDLADYLTRQVSGVRHQEGERSGATVICLYGELGSGKTTFVSGFAKGLSINSRLLSPTFIIVRRYEIPRIQNFLYHLDLYRISGEHALAGLGISEILADSGSYVLIEWAEKLGSLLPKKRIDAKFAVENGGNHTLWISHAQ